MRLFRSRKIRKAPEPDLSQPFAAEAEQENPPLSSTLAEKLDTLQTMFDNCTDFAYRELKIGQERVPVLLLYVNGITDEQTVNQDILKSLVKHNWDDIFPTVDYQISCEVEILSTGMISNPTLRSKPGNK